MSEIDEKVFPKAKNDFFVLSEAQRYTVYYYCSIIKIVGD